VTNATSKWVEREERYTQQLDAMNKRVTEAYAQVPANNSSTQQLNAPVRARSSEWCEVLGKHASRS
jgi:hypothetical protein